MPGCRAAGWWVWPDYRFFPGPETVILDIGGRVGGNSMFGFITFVLLVVGLAAHSPASGPDFPS